MNWMGQPCLMLKTKKNLLRTIILKYLKREHGIIDVLRSHQSASIQSTGGFPLLNFKDNLSSGFYSSEPYPFVMH